MKKLHVFFLVMLFAVLTTGRINAADTVYVNVGNNYFAPANFTVTVGNYVTWVLTEGTHNTVSSSVPSGAASWNHIFGGVGSTFTYLVTHAGSYNYSCTFHPGMNGSFTAELPTFPFVEDFDYPVGDSLSSHGWIVHSGGTTNAITVTSPGLTYPGYLSSGIGNTARLTTSGQDVNKQFNPVTSGSIYAGVMVNVVSAQTGDYFFHFGLANTTSIFLGRVYVKLAANGNLAFGLSKSSLGGTLNIQPVYSDSIYTTGTTYLLVLKYEIHPGVVDDTVRLFINPAISPVEPTADLVHALANTNDPANIGGIYLRQGSASLAANVNVDGIRISSAWSDVIPVELVSFNATTNGNSVLLNWVTASEVNNRGFEIERRYNDNLWSSIGYVSGKGTTSEMQYYSYTDKNLQTGSYTYRLKQLDFDGSYAYSNEVEVDISAPVVFELSQNYPNPFNPATTITYSIPQASQVSLKVFNMLGQEVAILVNGVKDAGVHKVDLDASGLSSGIYFYQLEAGSFKQVKKMTLLK